MKKKVEATFGLVFIYTLNAVLWTINLLTYDGTNPKSQWLRVVCVVLWTAAAVFAFLRYRKSKKNEQTGGGYPIKEGK